MPLESDPLSGEKMPGQTMHWLSVAEPVQAWSFGQSVPSTLAWRYRKTGWLWLLAANQRGRSLDRSRLAGWLWPHVALGQARANLRVLLTDLQSVWKAAALPAVWVVQRDSLMLQSDGSIVTELDAIPPGAEPPAGWRQRLAARDPQRWGDTLPVDVDGELLGILQAVRSRLGRAEPATPQALSPTQASPVPPPPSAQIEPGVHHLVLWRIEPAWDLDESEPAPLWSPSTSMPIPAGRSGWFTACAQVTSRLAPLGATVVDSGDWGMTLVLGLGSMHNGQRWRALESMHHAFECFARNGLTVRMAAVQGRSAVQRLGEGVSVGGWRLRLLESLALWAEPDTLACPASWADLLSDCSGLEHHTVQFRDLTQAVEVCTVPLASLNAGLLPVGTGPAAPAFVGRRDSLERLLSLYHGCAASRSPIEACVVAPLGYGKTRLAAELARRVAHKGGQLWWIAAQPELRNIAWRALHQTLLRHLRTLGMDSGLRAALAAWGVELTEAQAQALQRFVQDGTVPQAELDALASSLACWWSAKDGSAEAAPSLVVVDDVQWLDVAFRMIASIQSAIHSSWPEPSCKS